MTTTHTYIAIFLFFYLLLPAGSTIYFYIMHEEHQYLDLIKRIINEGSFEDTRNGKTKCVFGESMKFTTTNAQLRPNAIIKNIIIGR